uniref:LOB domain-containing protein n=1 Tax=Quercus lobata TaxID=97700 RepID=A0A7N2MR77_QUELO
MRLSCNGCRILRKGCSDSCTIRPCLQWIKTPESQANATFFLAKFYGRAGLINLINAGPEHLRPAIFKSLLYEACGRIVNPIYGSTGLLWSGSWQLCQAAVEAVLKGLPITQVSSESAFKACDIRHVSKEEIQRPSDQLHKVKSRRSRFKKSSAAAKHMPKVESVSDELAGVTKSSAAAKHMPKVESVSDELAGVTWNELGGPVKKMSRDDELGTSENRSCGGGAEAETDCVSAETVEASLAKSEERADGSDVELDLDLSLGLGNWDRETCKVDVALFYPLD